MDDIKRNSIITFALLIFLGTLLAVKSANAKPFSSCETLLSENGFSSSGASAQAFNVAGMKMYGQKDYDTAARMFQCALDLDGSHVLAHYNLACVDSIRYGKTKDAGLLEELFHHLYKSISLDERRRMRARKDPDFMPVRSREEFRFLVSSEKERATEKSMVLTYQGAMIFEYGVFVDFKDPKGRPRSFRDGSGIFKKGGLYSLKSTEESVLPVVLVNGEMVGKKFKIHYIYRMVEGEGSGLYELGTEVKSLEKYR